MLPTTIRSPPAVGDYTPLAEFESQTPETFVGGKPVLHVHVQGATASIPKSQRGRFALFPGDAATAEDDEESVEQKVDLFVNSENMTIFSPSLEVGVAIPYPSISIHAVKALSSDGPPAMAVWMQLEFSDGGADDDDFALVELTVVPPDAAAEPSPASALYEAMAKCSDQHPDPNNGGEDDEGDEYDRIIFEGSEEHQALEGFTGVLRGAADGALPPPMPGSGGWITADNVHEYFDEDGNWIGNGEDKGEGEEEELGEGAGRVRAHDEVEANGEDDEAKRARVD